VAFLASKIYFTVKKGPLKQAQNLQTASRKSGTVINRNRLKTGGKVRKNCAEKGVYWTVQMAY